VFTLPMPLRGGEKMNRLLASSIGGGTLFAYASRGSISISVIGFRDVIKECSYFNTVNCFFDK